MALTRINFVQRKSYLDKVKTKLSEELKNLEQFYEKNEGLQERRAEIMEVWGRASCEGENETRLSFEKLWKDFHEREKKAVLINRNARLAEGYSMAKGVLAELIVIK